MDKKQCVVCDKMVNKNHDCRSVKCWFCKKKLYYSGHPKHEPEISTDIYAGCSGKQRVQKIDYIHVKCWNAIFKYARKHKKDIIG